MNIRAIASSLALASFVCLLFLTGCRSSLHRSINEPGHSVDIYEHLVTGKTNVFYFYGDW